MQISSRWTTRTTPSLPFFSERRAVVLEPRSASASRPARTNDVARPAESLIDPNEPRASSKGQKTAYRSESRITKANADHLRRGLSLNASPTNPPLDPPDICMEFAHGACLEPAWDPHGIRIGSRGNRRADRTENARQSRGFDAKPRRQDKARETHCPRIMGLAWTCTNLS